MALCSVVSDFRCGEIDTIRAQPVPQANSLQCKASVALTFLNNVIK